MTVAAIPGDAGFAKSRSIDQLNILAVDPKYVGIVYILRARRVPMVTQYEPVVRSPSKPIIARL